LIKVAKLKTPVNTLLSPFQIISLKVFFISAKEKREIQKFFRKIGKPRIFIYRTFAILIFLLIRSSLKEIDEIIIDEEYPGKSALIKNFLFQEIKKINIIFPKERIKFKQIGKKSRVHYLAYKTAIGLIQPDIKVGAREILRMIVK